VYLFVARPCNDDNDDNGDGDGGDGDGDGDGDGRPAAAPPKYTLSSLCSQTSESCSVVVVVVLGVVQSLVFILWHHRPRLYGFVLIS